MTDLKANLYIYGIMNVQSMLHKRTPDKETKRLREHFFQFPTPVPSLHVLFTSDTRKPDKKTLWINEHFFISQQQNLWYLSKHSLVMGGQNKQKSRFSQFE